MNGKAILVWTGIVIVVLFLVVAIFQMKKLASSKSNVEALGLRGTSRVAKPLSKTQAERLETHFLDVPAFAPQTTRASAGKPAQVNATLNQVEAINKLNARQSK